MKQLKLRGARPDESKQILNWLTNNTSNHFDPQILGYPTLQILCAYEDTGEVIAYLPVHRVLMMESIAVNPKASKLQVAQALRDLTKASELVADSIGIREVMFLGGHGGVGEMATGNGHSFEELPFKVYRNSLCAGPKL